MYVCMYVLYLSCNVYRVVRPKPTFEREEGERYSSMYINGGVDVLISINWIST